MYKPFYFLISLFSLLLLTIFSLLPENAYTQTFILKTEPEGALVTDEKDTKIGETPLDINTIIGKSKRIKIKKEGYETIAISFPEKLKKLSEFPSCISYCNECNVHFDNFPNAEKEKYSGTLILRKKFQDIEQTILITVDTPVIKIATETELGKINGSAKKMSSKDIHSYIGYAENMDLQALSAFEGSYIEPVFSNTDAKEKTNLYRPKIIFKPVIKKLQFDLEGSLLRDLTGPCVMECEWNISTLADKNKILATIPVKSSIYRTKNDYEIILHEMISESEKDLLSIDTLYNFLKKIETGYFAGLKSEPFPLKLSTKKNYSSQKDMLKMASSSVVTVENEKGFGSGVIISDDGYIITNHHVIEDGGDLFVKIGKETKIRAEVVRKISDYDIVLLKIKNNGLTSLPFGDSEKTSGGDAVFAIGTPLDKALGQSITKGIISGYREWNGVNFIQTDVSINSGNSGGPLLNEDGEIIGITTLKYSGKSVDGIGFCIPSNLIFEKLNLKKN